MYGHQGNYVLSLGQDGALVLIRTDRIPRDGIPRIQRMTLPTGRDPATVLFCAAISKNDSYGVTSVGKEMNLWNLVKMSHILGYGDANAAGDGTNVMVPPTAVAYHPQNNNLAILGKEDGQISICNLPAQSTTDRLRHNFEKSESRSPVTGLAVTPQYIVSAGADGYVCVRKLAEPYEGLTAINTGSAVHTTVQFNKDLSLLLVTQRGRLAVHSGADHRLVMLCEHVNMQSRISVACFSSTASYVYCALTTGHLSVFALQRGADGKTTLTHKGDVNLNLSGNVYVRSMHAHPATEERVVVGLEDGKMIELNLELH